METIKDAGKSAKKARGSVAVEGYAKVSEERNEMGYEYTYFGGEYNDIICK